MRTYFDPKPASLLSFLFGAILFTGCSSSSGDGVLHFRDAGFSIAPLSVPSRGMTISGISMTLPPENGFQANVNVMVQDFPGTMEEYVDLSRAEFGAMEGAEILSETVTSSEVSWEYTWAMNGRDLHLYGRAIKNGGSVYLVTATATESQWKKMEGELRACVESFAAE